MINIEKLSKGAHVIDVACGKGKTSAIKDFIITHYEEGILYCVDTKVELEKMYNFLLQSLVGTGKLRLDDIMIISSEKKFETELKNYQYDPYILTQKKIILITHVRFFTSLINYFLIYKPLQNEFTPGECFNGDFDYLLQRLCLRQWIIFDETPMWIKYFWSTDRSFISTFTDTIRGIPTCKPYSEIINSYNRFVKNTNTDPFRHVHKIDRIKRDSILSMIPKMYNTWVNMPKDIKEIGISFKPRDLIRDNINTHIIFFEGAADLILNDLNPIRLPGKKYNANVSFFNLEIKVNRNDKFNWEYYRRNLDPVIDIVQRHYAAWGQKTLVVVWRSEDSSKKESELRDLVKGYIEGQLACRGFGPEAKELFDVIYYGESKCKSTNEFADYQNIVLFGKWFMPNTNTYRFNMNWNTNVHPVKYNMWFYVQLLSRIGIRKHDGGNYNVFFTSDFLEDNNQIIRYLDDYFNRDIIPELNMMTEEDELEEILRNHNVKRIKEHLIKLCKLYPEIKNQVTNIDTTTPLEIHIPEETMRMIILDGKEDIHRHYPRSRERVEKALNKLLIYLI